MNRNRWRNSRRQIDPSARFLKVAAFRPEARSPSSAVDFGADMDFDIGERRNPVDQIARHRRLEVAANDQMQALDLRRKEHDRLTRRIAAADQRNLFAGAQARLDRRRPIGDARALEYREIGDVGAAIARAGSNDDCPCAQAAVAGQFQRERLA